MNKSAVLLCNLLLFGLSGAAQSLYPERNLSFENDKINLRLIVCDSIRASVIFDTGARSRCFLSKQIVHRYNPDVVLNEEHTASSLNGSMRASHIDAPSLSVGSVEVPIKQIVVPEDIRKISSFGDGLYCPNYKHDHRIWDINVDKAVCSIYSKDTLPEGGIVFPLIINKKKNALGVRVPMDCILGTDTLHTDYTYLLDTGLPRGFLLLAPPEEYVGFLGAKVQSLLTDNLYGQKEKRLRFTLDQIKFAGQNLMSVAGEAVVGDSQRALLDDFAISDAVGILGWQVLKHFNIMLDLKNMRLILTPCKRKIELRATRKSRWGLSPNLQHMRIGKIVAGGAADRAGLHVGDSIISIQGRVAKGITLQYIDTLRMLPTGTPISIRIDRQGKKHAFILKPDN